MTTGENFNDIPQELVNEVNDMVAASPSIQLRLLALGDDKAIAQLFLRGLLDLAEAGPGFSVNEFGIRGADEEGIGRAGVQIFKFLEQPDDGTEQL